MNRTSAKWLVCALALTLGVAAYAQTGNQVANALKLGAKGLESGAKGKNPLSALDTMDAWYKAGAAAQNSARVSAAINKAAKEAAQKPKGKISRETHFRNDGDFFRAITPTPVEKLRVRLIRPTQQQVKQAVDAYQQLMKDFESLRKEVDTKLLYNKLSSPDRTNMASQERRVLIMELGEIRSRAAKLSRVVFADDPALAKIIKWADTAMQQINPYYVLTLTNHRRLDSRVFNESEFFLDYPQENLPDGTAAYEFAVPENIRVAVLNDQEDVLDMYQAWAREGRLGKGWKVATFSDTRDLLTSLQSGNVYDLIITDLTVPGGGGYFLVDQVRDMQLDIPVLGGSMYTRDQINAQKMFDQGFDGYIYGDDMFEELAGSVKWMGQVKKYYFYKALRGWSR